MLVPLSLFAFFLSLNIVALFILFNTKAIARRRYARQQSIRQAFFSAVFNNSWEPLKELIDASPEQVLRLWRDFTALISLPQSESEPVLQLFFSSGIEKKLLQRLNSRRDSRRYSAVHLIRPLMNSQNIAHLANAFKAEKRKYIRLAMYKNMLELSHFAGLDVIADGLAEVDLEEYEAACKMFVLTSQNFIDWAWKNKGKNDLDYRLAILAGARFHVSNWLRDYVAEALTDDHPRIKSNAIDTAQIMYPDLILDVASGEKSDIIVRRAAVRSTVQLSYPLNLEEYVENFKDPALTDIAVSCLDSYLQRHPEETTRITSEIPAYSENVIQKGLSLAMVNRLAFLLASGKDRPALEIVFGHAIAGGKSAAIIGFINANQDSQLQTWLLELVSRQVEINPQFYSDCTRYLKPEIRREIQLPDYFEEKSSRKIPLTRWDRVLLVSVLVLIIAIPVSAIAWNLHGATIGKISIFLREVFRYFTYGFAFYAVALNIIYIVLIFFAQENLSQQDRFWKIVDKDYLFTPGILPSISILAPAYNEELNVVQSVYSLLTLEYPDYEVIVINDGSADKTIDVLMEEFELERVDPPEQGKIETAPIRSIYRSAKNSKLLVIDKENGGKADALNSGINLASRNYICSIDSDSLLEPDALLRMTAQILSSDRETIAVGGNILPVNGCTVERGMLQTIALSKNRYARLQTIEYLRAFISGRLGWAQLNSLLIISGAFGLFKRSRVLEIGGYLTGRGEFKRDTVGEDMELVVRLTRRMRRIRQKYRIQYAATANCWTEVPEDLSSLYKQRDRWHRGLLEILTYHKSMMLNPKYGSAGLIAFPYYLFFEIIGPFYEFIGYPLLIIGLLTGALGLPNFITMFSAILLFSMLITLISFILSERGIVYFRRNELRILLLYSVIENFGFRQIMGWVRVFAMVTMLYKTKGWQKLNRKGFQEKG